MANASGDVIEDVVEKKEKKERICGQEPKSGFCMCACRRSKTAPLGRGASWTYCHCGLKLYLLVCFEQSLLKNLYLPCIPLHSRAPCKMGTHFK